jgi:hypothetical protein
MSPRAPRSFADLVRTFGLLALWCLTVAWMAVAYLRDPFDPSLEGTHARGHNGQGALWDGVIVTLVELAVLHLLLRPWQKERSWAWPALTVILLVPWTMFSAMLCMHAGSIFFIHLFWLFMVGMALVGAGAGAGVRAVKRRA